MENKIILYGASGHGKVIVDCLDSQDLKVDLILDDNPAVDFVSGIPVVHSANFKWSSKDMGIISIGDNTVRKAIAEKLNTNFLTAIHQKAVVSKQASIGEGTVVMAGAIINPSAVVGKHCIVNTGAVIEHDCLLEDFVHVSPNASLAGDVKVGDGTHIGIGATVIQGVTIGKWAVIGAGAVIIRDVEDFTVVVGNPAKKIKDIEKI